MSQTVTPKTYVVIGATSDMAIAYMELSSQMGDQLIMAGRDALQLDRLARHHTVKTGKQVLFTTFDANSIPSVHSLIRYLEDQCSSYSINQVLICHSMFPDELNEFHPTQQIIDCIQVNYTSTCLLAEYFGQRMKAQKTGTIAVISSVAGDRGRGSNYLYGSTKAAVTAYLSGLRNRLFKYHVHVLTIKPGFVYTKMTANILRKSSPLVASPQTVAKSIRSAINRKQDIIYTPFFWRWIMLIIRYIPEFIFKRLSL